METVIIKEGSWNTHSKYFKKSEALEISRKSEEIFLLCDLNTDACNRIKSYTSVLYVTKQRVKLYNSVLYVAKQRLHWCTILSSHSIYDSSWTIFFLLNIVYFYQICIHSMHTNTQIHIYTHTYTHKYVRWKIMMLRCSHPCIRNSSSLWFQAYIFMFRPLYLSIVVLGSNTNLFIKVLSRCYWRR